MKQVYKMKGTCAEELSFELDDNQKVRNVVFVDGCSGNLHGIAKLVEGMDARQLVDTLKGTRCGRKRSSCPDQLAIAIEQALANQA
jgi:uncharacterized protein (TIGR03905 family)